MSNNPPDRANDQRRIPNFPLEHGWGPNMKTKEDKDEYDSKMTSKYMADAIESNKEHQAKHEAEVAEQEGK